MSLAAWHNMTGSPYVVPFCLLSRPSSCTLGGSHHEMFYLGQDNYDKLQRGFKTILLALGGMGSASLVEQSACTKSPHLANNRARESHNSQVADLGCDSD